jgi:hypothetical protein
MNFKILTLLTTLLSLIFTSCTVVKTSEIITLNFNRAAAKEEGGDYIKFKDGSKINGKISEYRVQTGKGIFRNVKKSVTMDGKEYETKNIISFQKDSAAFARLENSNIFAERKMAGKINVYFVHYNESGTDSRGRPYHDVYDLHWLQKGADGKIEKFSVKKLEEMVSDYPTSLDLINDYKNAKGRKKSDSDLVAAIELYNKRK